MLGIFDSGYGRGSYNVYANSVNVMASGGEFGSSEESAPFGSCGFQPTTPPPTPNPTNQPTFAVSATIPAAISCGIFSWNKSS